MNKNKPQPLTTKRYKRNILIACIVVAALLCAGIALFKMPQSSGQKVPTILGTEKFEPTVTEVQDEPVETDNTPEKAREFIRSYYVAIAEKDVSKLRSMGCVQAADAMEYGWLADIGYSIDKTKLDNPTKSEFPMGQGIYAGCTIYRISDFYEAAPAQAIKSNITGETGAEGWVYFDSLNAKWVIADPTIPTAVCAAQSKTVERESYDKKVSIKMASPGAYCSPWWGYTQVSVEINNKDENRIVTLAPAVYDNGITSRVPVELGDTVLPKEQKNGICQVYRGTVSGFGIEKIGAAPLMIDGNVCPLVIVFDNENISPIFAIGTESSDDIVALLTQKQIDDFNARNEGFSYATRDYSSLIGNSNANANGNENNGDAENGNDNANSNSNE